MRAALLLPLLAALVAMATAAERQEALEKTRRGLEAASRLSESLSPDLLDSASSGFFLNVLTNIVSLVSGIMGIIGDGKDSGAEAPDMRHLREQFVIVQRKLDSIQLQLQDVLQLIQWSTARLMYANLEKHVVDCSRSFDTFVTASQKEQGFYWRQFRSQFAAKKQAAYQLYQAVVERDYVISKNLAAAVVQFSKNHQPKVASFLLWLTRVILRGAQMEIAYERMEYSATDAALMESLWRQRAERLGRRLQEIDRQVRQQWQSQMLQDLRQMGIDRGGDARTAEAAYSFLTEKFPWRHWLVLAFTPGSFSAVSVCPGSHIFGGNLAVSSTDSKEAVRFNKAAAQRAVQVPPISGFAAGALLTRVKANMPNCRQAALWAVLYRHVNTGENSPQNHYWLVADPQRRAYGVVSSYIIIFGRRLNRAYHAIIFG